ncbi:dihydrodipicolinate synthase family protein [Spirochaetia bacterium]|nr:dihydrodipicolinate synthase family protein [Spirochaetia bacterium]
MTEKLCGIFAPITTPFNKDGSVNYEHLGANVQRYAKTDLKGFLILGSNGENKSLRQNEKEQVVKTIIAAKAPGQVTMVGSIFESTTETVEFAKMAEQAGADFITLLPPSYFKSQMKDSVLLKYFTDTASSVKTPCLLYKAPQFSGGVDLSLNLIKDCAGHPGIAGIKDSSSSGIEKILLSVPEGFAVLSGSANTFFTAMLSGATGGVISMADYMPEKITELYTLIRSGKLKEAADLNNRIVKCNINVSGSWGVAGVKCAMDICGYHGGAPRLPLLPVPDEGVNALKRSLAI